TDWRQMAELYGLLLEVQPSPVVELNRAVAVAQAYGEEAGLRLLDELESRGALPGYHLLPAARADLLRRLGRAGEAARAYRRALALAANPAQQRFLGRRLAEGGASSGDPRSRTCRVGAAPRGRPPPCPCHPGRPQGGAPTRRSACVAWNLTVVPPRLGEACRHAP